MRPAGPSGKELIGRRPHGKAGVRLVDQARARAIRVSARPEAFARIERSEWFRSRVDGAFATKCGLASSLSEELLASPEDALFAVSPVFPLKIENPRPRFETATCEACGESVLAAYVREVAGRRVCVSCEEQCLARAG